MTNYSQNRLHDMCSLDFYLFFSFASLRFHVYLNQEYLPDSDSEEVGGPTLVVVSLVLEIQGDSTK